MYVLALIAMLIANGKKECNSYMFWIILGSIILKIGVVCQFRCTSAILLYMKKVTPIKVKLIIGLSQMFMLGWHLFIIITTFFPKDL